MADPLGLASGTLALATFAFQSSVSLYETVKRLHSHPKRVRDLLGELEALSHVLARFVDLIKSNYTGDLSLLDLPLLRCGNTCKEFQQELLRFVSRSNSNQSSFRDWARMTYMGDNINDFCDLLAGYKATINIALTDAALRQSAVAVESLVGYEGLIQDAEEDLVARLESIDGKLEQLAEKDRAQSGSDVVELHSLREERLSTEKCLQICAQLSSHIDQIQLMSDDVGPSRESVRLGASLEAVTNEGLQECRNSLALTAAKLEKHIRDIMDRLLSKSKTSISSDKDAQDLPSLRDEAAIPSTRSDSGDSDSSFDDNSVFSDPLSIPSTSSLDPGKEEIIPLLILQFADLLNEDGVVLLLLSTGISKKLIGFQKMQNKFRRLLKQFANNLEADIVSEPHRDLKRFVSSYSVIITRELFAIAPFDKHQNIKPQALEAEQGAGLVEKGQAQQRRVELYLQSLHRGNTAPQASEEIKVLSTDDEESDQDSVAEEVGVVEPYEGSLQNLDQMKNFILESTAYQILRRQLEEFVQSSLNCQFRAIVTQWSNPEHKSHGDIDRYKLRNLVTELQNVDPFKIQYERNENGHRFIRFVSSFQHKIERWTGEPWEWWPLPRCQRPLSESETRLRWKCECGEERWAEVPNILAKRLQSIIRSLAVDASTTPMTHPPPKAHARSSPNHYSTLSKSEALNQVSVQGHGGQQRRGTLPNPTFRRPTSGNKVTVADISLSRLRVLFLVSQGGEYRLSQISVGEMTCNSFFNTMKEEYFRLRGVLRGWLSIWRYSHCDFYKFEKFDDSEFALRMKDSFPDHTNTDYEYQPRPMDNIPPISEHEFTKRFYSCQKSRQLFHPHHRCKPLGAHSSDILKFLPKKTTRLEEAGDKRENFWGIYAHEVISLRWIIFYNFVCISPLFAFFLAWIVPQGLGTDLQDPSVPVSIMFSILSLFWSVFLGSLQFGRSH